METFGEHASSATSQAGDLLSMPIVQYAIVGYLAWKFRDQILDFIAGLAGGFLKRIDAARKG